MNFKRYQTVCDLVIGLVATLVLLLYSPKVVLADDITVCPPGAGDCDYYVVQDAVDAANKGDVIKVAAGVYTGAQGRPALLGYAGPSVITGAHNYWGDPAFINPNAGDYHLGPGSTAIDRGLNAGVTNDIDGDPRPIGLGYDLGADEFTAGLNLSKRAHLPIVQAGSPLTYTLWLTNTGIVLFTATITDTLSAHVTPSGIVTWTDITLAPGETWTQTVIVSINLGYAGPLTNIVQATTLQGVTGVYTETSTVLLAPPGAPTLLAPPNGAATTSPAVTLTWTAGAGAPPSGYNLDMDGLIITNTATTSPTILPLGVHTWTARAYNAAGYSDWAAPWAFEIIQISACVPITALTFAPSETCQFSPTTFTPSITPTDASLPINYVWDFGDGSPLASSPNPTHTYECGPNTVTLTVSNACSQQTISQSVQVLMLPCCVPPQVSFTHTRPVEVNAPIAFSNTTTWCVVYPISYTWDFGDGSTLLCAASRSANRVDTTGGSPPLAAVDVTHTYSTTGQFTVWLTASMHCGCDNWVSGFYSRTLNLVEVAAFRIYLPVVLKNH